MDTHTQLQKARDLYQNNQWADGCTVCEEIIKSNKQNIDAALLLAQGYAKTNRSAAAEAILRKVTEIQPNNVDALTQLASVVANFGRFDQAVTITKSAIIKSKNPSFQLRKILAYYLYRVGNLRDSIQINHAIMQQRPDDPEPWSNIINCLLDLKNPQEAIQVAHAATKSGHRGFLFSALEGKANQMLGHHEQSVKNFIEAIDQLGTTDEQDHRLIELKIYLALALFAAHNFSGAYETLTQLQAETIEQFSLLPLLAQSAFMSGHFDQAIPLLSAAIQQFSERWDLYYSLARIYIDRGQENTAESLLSRLPNEAPNRETFHTLMGSIKLAQRLYEESRHHFETANHLTPDDFEPILGILSTAKYSCDFELFNQIEPTVIEKFREDKSIQISTFTLLSLPSATTGDQLEAANRQAATLLSPKKEFIKNLPARTNSNQEKIRVGFLTNDFRRHATGFLFREHTQLLDHTSIEWHLFYWDQTHPEDLVQAEMRANMDHVHDISHLADNEAAQFIKNRNIDILIDLKGYTKGCRPCITAQKPARTTINWLGFPGTMGQGMADYIILDETILPHEGQNSFGEKILRMPHSYFPVPMHHKLGDSTEKSAHGLPSSGFVFGCFNQSYKISPDAFEAWCKILTATGDSVLWLLLDNKIAQKNLIAQAGKHGIESHRIIFATYIRHEDNLERLRHMDLMLDTFYCNGHTTAADALSQGVPVLTKRGKTFPAQVAASLLSAVDLPELITETTEAYIELAVKIAGNKRTHQKYKKMLDKNREKSALFNSEQFIQDFEKLLVSVASVHQPE